MAIIVNKTSNRHRNRLLHHDDDIGKSKVVAVVQHMQRLNSDTLISGVAARFDPSNVAAFCEQVDLVPFGK